MSKNIFWKASILVYLVSLFLPAYKSHAWPIDKGPLGIEVLAVGWFAIIFAEPRWFANIAYFYVILCKASSTKIRAPSFTLLFLLFTALSITILYRFSPASLGVEDFRFSYGAYTWSVSLLLASYEVYLSQKETPA
jgi:hypothetical protein